jgi:hypothetical protein
MDYSGTILFPGHHTGSPGTGKFEGDCRSSDPIGVGFSEDENEV